MNIIKSIQSTNVFLKNKIDNVRAKLKFYLKKERLIATSLLSRVLGLVMILTVAPAGTIQISNAKAIIEEPVNTDIQFSVQHSMPVYIPAKKIPEIALGESTFDRVERERADAENASKINYTVSRNIAARESFDRSYPDDASFDQKRALAKSAAAKYGIDWKILEAVWQVESGKAWNTPVKSYAGAQGPMQFMSGTWNKYAVDGNGDGAIDINYAEDAVYAGANLLAQAGAADGNVDAALLSYNHAQWYVDKVKAIANSIGG